MWFSLSQFRGTSPTSQLNESDQRKRSEIIIVICSMFFRQKILSFFTGGILLKLVTNVFCKNNFYFRALLPFCFNLQTLFLNKDLSDFKPCLHLCENRYFRSAISYFLPERRVAQPDRPPAALRSWQFRLTKARYRWSTVPQSSPWRT